jgi:photosystem II stability/assembly factor-like uncharacterized protein
MPITLSLSLRPLAGLALLASLGATTFFAAGASPAATPDRQPYAWRNVAIGCGGFVTGLVFHPAQRDLLYARTDVGGAFRWDATHRRWLPLNDSLAHENAEWLGIVSLAVDARDPQRLYLAAGSYLEDWGKTAALLWSNDQGQTWGGVPLPFRLGGNTDGRSAGERLQVDPHDGKVLFLGTNQDGLWRSADQGQTWKRVSGFPGAGLTFVLFDPRSGFDGRQTPRLYAGASDLKGPALYCSADAGATWSPVPGQPSGLLVHHAAFDPAGVLYLACANRLGPNGVTDGAVWKLEPVTGRWTNLTPVAPDAATDDKFGYAGLAVDARQPGVLMVTTLDRWARGDEIYRTTDGGATWKPLRATSTWDSSSAPYVGKLKPHWMGHIALDPFDSDRALFITGYGVWATDRATSCDHGAPTPWTFADDGLEETVVDDLVSPPAGAPLVSAICDVGGFRHDDLDVPPRAGAHQPPYGNNASIAFAERAPLKLVRTHSGAARGALSLDGGATWRDFAAMPPSAAAYGPGSIALSADGRCIVWLPKGSAPFVSSDDGATWTPSRGGPVGPGDYRTDVTVADRVNADKFYIYDSVSGRVFASTDGGKSFSATAALHAGGGTLRAAPGRDGSVWVPTPEGLFVSNDTGAHFAKLAGVDAAVQIGFGAMGPGGGPPMLFMLGRVRGVPALCRSDDLGRSWIAISDGPHQFGWLKVITGDPRAPGRVYLGTGGRGIVVGEPDGR